MLNSGGPYIDASVYAGPYPFRALPAETPAGLTELLRRARIETAIITPFASIFRADPIAAMVEWSGAATTQRGPFHFWAVINPAMPGWQKDFQTVLTLPRIAGIRLFPRYHGYGVFDRQLGHLLEAAAGAGLPVNLTARLLDDRLHPRMLRADPPLDIQEVSGLMKQFRSVEWVLSCFHGPEILALASTLRTAANTWIDAGFAKPEEEWWLKAAENLPFDRILIGTGAPLNYYLGTLLAIRRSGFGIKQQDAVLRENPRRFLAERKQAP